MIKVHHLLDSRSFRIIWLLEELGIPYEIVPYERDPVTRAAPSTLKAVHPLGKSPVIVDGDVTIAETGLILQYLCQQYDDGRLATPAVPDAHNQADRRWLYWLHYAEGSAMPVLAMRLLLSRLPEDVAGPVRASLIDPQLALHIDFWEAELDQTAWFAGDRFSAADIAMAFPIEIVATRLGLGPERLRLTEFLDRTKKRPAYRMAVARAAPKSAAP